MYARIENQLSAIGIFAQIAKQAIVMPNKSSTSSTLSDQEVELIRTAEHDPEFMWTRSSYERLVTTLKLIVNLMERIIIGIYMLAGVSFFVGLAWLFLHKNV